MLFLQKSSSIQNSQYYHIYPGSNLLNLMLRSIVPNPDMRRHAPAQAPRPACLPWAPSFIPEALASVNSSESDLVGFSVSSRLEIENLNGWLWEQEKPLGHKLCHSHCFYSDMNLCSTMQILRSWCQSVQNKRILV